MREETARWAKVIKERAYVPTEVAVNSAAEHFSRPKGWTAIDGRPPASCPMRVPMRSGLKKTNKNNQLYLAGVSLNASSIAGKVLTNS